VHETSDRPETLSTPADVAAILKADPRLDANSADALAAIFRTAYSQLAALTRCQPAESARRLAELDSRPGHDINAHDPAKLAPLGATPPKSHEDVSKSGTCLRLSEPSEGVRVSWPRCPERQLSVVRDLPLTQREEAFAEVNRWPL
jgi:hypothetical protein